MEQKIADLHSSSAFVKVRNDYFDIGQVLFSFVKTKDGKAVNSIDCCLSFKETLGLVFQVTTGRVAARMGEEYAWKSGIGGVHEEDAKRRGLRDDGLAVARWFGIQSANAGWARFTATSVGGKTDRKGLIVPVKERPVTITIPIPSEEELVNMMLEVAADIVAYKSSRYTCEWDSYQEEARKARAQARENEENGSQVPVETGSEKSQDTSEATYIESDAYFCLKKGSVVERRGNKGDAIVLRMVVPRIFNDTPLESDAKWQLAEVIFYEKAIDRAGGELAEQIRELIMKAESGFDSLSLKKLRLKIGDIRDGYRQLTFSAKK